MIKMSKIKIKTLKNQALYEPEQDLKINIDVCKPSSVFKTMDDCKPAKGYKTKKACKPDVSFKTPVPCDPSMLLPSGITTEQLIHLRSLVRKHQDMQKARQAFASRIRSINDGATTEGRIGFLIEDNTLKGAEMSNGMENIGKKNKKFCGVEYWEKDLVKQMTDIVENHKLWVEWLYGVKGISILTAAKMIAYFEPYWAELELESYVKKKEHTGEELEVQEKKMHKFYRPQFRSSLTNLCGYGVNKDHRAFCKANYTKDSIMGNAEYKKTFYILFECIIRQKGKCYDVWKTYDVEVKAKMADYLTRNYGFPTRPECRKANSKVYIPNTLDLSRRRFIKTFISILWEKYQQIYGLPITRPQHNPDPTRTLSDKQRELTDKQWIHPEDLMEHQVK